MFKTSLVFFRHVILPVVMVLALVITLLPANTVLAAGGNCNKIEIVRTKNGSESKILLYENGTWYQDQIQLITSKSPNQGSPPSTTLPPETPLIPESETIGDSEEESSLIPPKPPTLPTASLPPKATLQTLEDDSVGRSTVNNEKAVPFPPPSLSPPLSVNWLKLGGILAGIIAVVGLIIFMQLRRREC